MKQVQKVWEQLGSQKVELSVMADIKELNKLVNRMPSSMDLGNDVERAYDLVLQAQKEADRQLKKKKRKKKKWLTLPKKN